VFRCVSLAACHTKQLEVEAQFLRLTTHFPIHPINPRHVAGDELAAVVGSRFSGARVQVLISQILKRNVPHVFIDDDVVDVGKSLESLNSFASAIRGDDIQFGCLITPRAALPESLGDPDIAPNSDPAASDDAVDPAV
jgi:hypothetical protein